MRPGGDPTLVESYRRLADVFHEVLAEQTLDALLVRIADTVGDLIPSLDTLTIYEADETKRVLKPVLVRDVYADEIMSTTISFSEGITGWATRHREAVLCNQAHLDPRVRTVPGTPMEPEALICVPLIARGQIKGALNIYREGDGVAFSETEFEIAKRFGDAAALALDNAEIRARLEHQARTDSLTGLFNHSVFYERLLHSLQESSRTHMPLAVLMLDIDDFKHVNDVHGHAVGDELLRFLAEALRAIVRPDDVICRLGGEEFAVVMDGCGGEDAVRVAERVQSRLAAVDFPGIGRMTVSVGLALGPEHAMNPRELAACAEAAMMTAKAQGKNQVVLYDEGGARRPDAPGDRARRPLDRAPEDAAEPDRQAEPAERRAGDRRRDRRRAAVARRLPQLPRLRRRRRRAHPGRLPRRPDLGRGRRSRSTSSASASARESPAAAPSSASRSSSPTPRTASSGS